MSPMGLPRLAVVERVWSAPNISLACYIDKQTDVRGTDPKYFFKELSEIKVASKKI